MGMSKRLRDLDELSNRPIRVRVDREGLKGFITRSARNAEKNSKRIYGR